MSDDDAVIDWITTVQREWGAGTTSPAMRWQVAMVGAMVVRLRDRVTTQEQRIAALEARLAALEQQVGRPDAR